MKPGNILLALDGTAKLGDFGLARGEAPSDLTLEHASIGTPQYVAPEQMRRGSDATTRSDLFSLGATLYHMMTGRPPFDGQNLGEIVQNVLSCTYAPPETVAKGLSRDACYVIGHLMRAHPRDRYASAAELAADLERIGQGERVAPADFAGDYQAFVQRRRGRRNAVVAACVAVLGCAGALIYHRQAAVREQSELEQRCSEIAAVGADLAQVGTVDALNEAIAAMKEAQGRAAGCGSEITDPLRLRLQAASDAVVVLSRAEAALDGAGRADAKYRLLDGKLEQTRLSGVDGRIEAIRRDIRRISDEAARKRYDRVVFETWDEVKAEVRSLAADLKDRYLEIDEQWVAEIVHARDLLDGFDAPSPRLDECRRGFDADLDADNYASAAAWLKQLLEEK